VLGAHGEGEEGGGGGGVQGEVVAHFLGVVEFVGDGCGVGCGCRTRGWGDEVGVFGVGGVDEGEGFLEVGRHFFSSSLPAIVLGFRGRWWMDGVYLDTAVEFELCLGLDVGIGQTYRIITCSASVTPDSRRTE